MRTNHNDISDFYSQISILLKSGLPLPDSIEQLGLNFNKPDFKKVLLNIAKNTSEGKTLAETMKGYPNYFSKLHIQMIETGEKSGMLPETLSEVARTSQMNMQLVSMIRQISIYPIFTIWFAFLVVFSLCIIVIPQAQEILDEMLSGEPLPWLTAQVMDIGTFFVEYMPFFIAAIIIYALFFIWFLSGSIPAKKLFLRGIRFIPGAYTIFYNLNMARLCSIWSVLMQQKTPSGNALELTQEMMEDRRIAAALKRVSKSLTSGKSLVDAFKNEHIISGMIPLTINHVPEKELPRELMNLAHLFRERASTSSRNFTTVLSIVLLLMIAIIIGIIVIAMFLPFISIVSPIGGY